MIRIIATEEQAKKIVETTECVEIVDVHGNRLGYLARPFSPDELDTAKRRLASSEERRCTQIVIDHLNSIEG